MQKSLVFPRIGLDIHGKHPQICVHTQLFNKQSCMQPRSMIFKCSNGSNSNFMCRMVLEWRECEHGDVEEAVRADLMLNKHYVHAGFTSFGVLVA